MKLISITNMNGFLYGLADDNSLYVWQSGNWVPWGKIQAAMLAQVDTETMVSK